MEKFNPHNVEYKTVEHLPSEEQENFVNFDKGFVKKEALKAWEFWEKEAKEANEGRSLFKKIINLDKQTALNLAQQEAVLLNILFNEERDKEAEKQEHIREASAELEKFREVTELWMGSVARRLSEHLANSSIGAVISEDRSGRLPSDIILAGINKIYQKNNCPAIKLVGLDTGQEIQSFYERFGDDTSPINKQKASCSELGGLEISKIILDSIKDGSIRDNILYVTEYINEGITINRAIGGITHGINSATKEGINTDAIGIIAAPMGGMYRKLHGHVIRRIDSLKGLVGPGQFYKNEFGDLFRKYSGLDKKAPLSENELALRDEFVDEMSNKFVQFYLAEKNKTQ